jgi:hypothetical protein
VHLFSGLRRLHLEDHFYFIGVGFDAFGGDQTTEYFAPFYSKNTFLWIELELGFTHIGKVSARSVMYVAFFLLAMTMPST